MAKGLFGMGGGGPRMTNNGSPGGIRPMPRPTPGAMAAPVGGPLARVFGAPGSDMRSDMALEMLKAAMASAPQSGSPALQFLAPLVGGLSSARIEQRRADARAAEVSAMTDSVLGPQGLSPAAKRALDIMNNENAPDYLKKLAEKQFERETAGVGAAAPRRGGGGGGGGKPSAGESTGTGTPATPTRVYGAPFEINGFLYQRDGYGNAVPMKGPDGQNVPAKGGAAPVPGAANPEDDPLGLRAKPQDNPLEIP